MENKQLWTGSCHSERKLGRRTERMEALWSEESPPAVEHCWRLWCMKKHWTWESWHLCWGSPLMLELENQIISLSLVFFIWKMGWMIPISQGCDERLNLNMCMEHFVNRKTVCMWKSLLHYVWNVYASRRQWWDRNSQPMKITHHGKARAAGWNTGCPVEFDFQINNKYFFSISMSNANRAQVSI